MIASITRISRIALLTPIQWAATIALSAIVCTTAAHGQMSTLATAAEIGITPESIAAADLEEHATTVLTILDLASADRTALALNHESAHSTAQTISQLSQALLSGGDDVDAIAQLHADAVAQLQGHRNQITNIQNGLFSQATVGLPSALLVHLEQWRSAAVYRVPAAFKILQRTEQEWKLIEKALRSEKRALRRGDAFEGPDAELLSGLRSHPEVTAAQARLDLHLTQVRAVFDGFVEQP